jgi:hypothetical protein
MAIIGTADSANLTLLNGVTATGAGDWARLNRNKSVQIQGISSATVKIQCTNDRGATAYALLETTADGMWEGNLPYMYIRANVTAYTSGTIYVYACSDDN